MIPGRWAARIVHVVAMLAIAGVALVAVAVATSAAGTSRTTHVSCGKERWEVKTLKDDAASEVRLKPASTTIEKPRKLKVPIGLSRDSDRFIPQETKTYRVKALLMSVKRESDDDLHLVIADPRVGGSMIVEFPASDCVGARSHDQMVSARAALRDACGDAPSKTGSLWTLQGTATVVGVA